MTRPALKAFIVGLLRRGTYRWPPRSDALKKARVERGLYQCAMCKLAFKKKEVQVDHIIPVVSIKTGFSNWEEYIERMFPMEDGFQILCKPCHSTKTDTENHYRKKVKTRKKKK